jgi:hypothetical protein
MACIHVTPITPSFPSNVWLPPFTQILREDMGDVEERHPEQHVGQQCYG